MLAVLADVELTRAAASDGTAAATPAAAVASARAATQPCERSQQQQPQQQQQTQQPQQQQQQQAGAGGAAPADDPAATANLGRAWSKADIGTLARLAEDRAFLLATIPRHPAEGELDWELIARHFGRWGGRRWTGRGGQLVQEPRMQSGLAEHP